MLKILKQGKVLVRFSAHRTRKSFLLNRLLGKQDGFSLGSTHERQKDIMRTEIMRRLFNGTKKKCKNGGSRDGEEDCERKQAAAESGDERTQGGSLAGGKGGWPDEKNKKLSKEMESKETKRKPAC